MQPGENPPIGIVLCSEKSDERVELLQLEKSGIGVSQFITELPSKEVFESDCMMLFNEQEKWMKR